MSKTTIPRCSTGLPRGRSSKETEMVFTGHEIVRTWAKPHRYYLLAGLPPQDASTS